MSRAKLILFFFTVSTEVKDILHDLLIKDYLSLYAKDHFVFSKKCLEIQCKNRWYGL